MDARVTKEMKLMLAKELLGNYLRGEGGKNLKPNEIGHAFKEVYESLDHSFPEAEQRRVGLG